jgi:hypothetical protein
VCHYEPISLDENVPVSGSQANGYRATFDAQGYCQGYELLPSGLNSNAGYAVTARVTIVDKVGVGKPDTVKIVKPADDLGIEFATTKIEAGDFTVRPER